jgi:branched-chain amino acid transport system permease protein
METILGAFVIGVTVGFIYLLMGAGLSLIYGILRILNLAHGEFYMIAAFVAFFLPREFGTHVIIAVIISIIVVVLLGLLLEKVVLWPLRNDLLRVVLGIVGVQLILQGTASIISYGTGEKYVMFPIRGAVHVLGTSISYQGLTIICVGGIVMVALYFFLRLSKHGQAMYALEQDSEGATIQGVNVMHIRLLAMGIAGGLAALSGWAAGTLYSLTPLMGFEPLMKGLTIVLLGGIGSLTGTVIAAFGIGMLESFIATFVARDVASMAVFLVLILTLYLRPGGLLGHALE